MTCCRYRCPHEPHGDCPGVPQCLAGSGLEVPGNTDPQRYRCQNPAVAREHDVFCIVCSAAIDHDGPADTGPECSCPGCERAAAYLATLEP